MCERVCAECTYSTDPICTTYLNLTQTLMNNTMHTYSVANLIQYLYEINTAHDFVMRKHCVTNGIICLNECIHIDMCISIASTTSASRANFLCVACECSLRIIAYHIKIFYATLCFHSYFLSCIFNSFSKQ